MLKWIALGLLVSFMGLGSYVYIYTKAYETPELSGVHLPHLHLFYKEHLGPYHRIDPTLREVEKEAVRVGLPCRKTFGHFLDDPQRAEEDRLRSEVGCWLEEAPPSEILTQTKLQYEKRKGGSYLRITWTGSPAIGPIKVYPAARDWFEKQRKLFPSSNYEVYETLSGGRVMTTYYFAVKEE